MKSLKEKKSEKAEQIEISQRMAERKKQKAIVDMKKGMDAREKELKATIAKNVAMAKEAVAAGIPKVVDTAKSRIITAKKQLDDAIGMRFYVEDILMQQDEIEQQNKFLKVVELISTDIINYKPEDVLGIKIRLEKASSKLAGSKENFDNIMTDTQISPYADDNSNTEYNAYADALIYGNSTSPAIGEENLDASLAAMKKKIDQM
ncbi:MAG: hypothetical protein RRY78_05805 [Clostridia bacterium]